MLPQLPHLDWGFQRINPQLFQKDPSEQWLMEQLGTHGVGSVYFLPFGGKPKHPPLNWRSSRQDAIYSGRIMVSIRVTIPNWPNF